MLVARLWGRERAAGVQRFGRGVCFLTVRVRMMERNHGLRSHDVSKRWDGSHVSVPSLKGLVSRERTIGMLVL